MGLITKSILKDAIVNSLRNKRRLLECNFVFLVYTNEMENVDWSKCFLCQSSVSHLIFRNFLVVSSQRRSINVWYASSQNPICVIGTLHVRYART